MASSAAIISPTSSLCLSSLSSSSSSRKQSFFCLSFSCIPASHFSHVEISHPGFAFTQWNGLKRIQGSSFSSHLVKIGRKRKDREKGVYASLFGVGAPEALVIGVVALLVFGPKGLAEVARNLGKTLRAFQPTIRELQEVSREFKSTLEREIGLDDIPTTSQDRYTSSTTRTTSSPSQNISSGESQMTVDPNGSPSPSKAYSSEDLLKITEEQLKAASAVHEQSEEASPSNSQSEVEATTPQEQTVSASTSESQSKV